MKELEIFPSLDRIERQTYVADSPIDFATWLELSYTIDSELVRGVMIHRMVAQYPHEWIFMWLSTVLSGFVQNRQLGKVLGSRTAVKISENDGMSVVANGCQVVTNCTGMTGEKGFLRHFGGAHYAFVDGHIKWYRPEQVNDNQGGNTNPKPFDGSYPSFQVQ